MKTTIFEHTNEISTIKAGQKNLNSNLEEMAKEFDKFKEMETEDMKSMLDLKSDLSSLKTGVSSLSTTVFNLKSHVFKHDLIPIFMNFIDTFSLDCVLWRHEQ